MPCKGTGDCFQGRRRCATPIHCSGRPAEEVIERLQMHREPLPLKPEYAPSSDEDGLGHPVAAGVLLVAIFTLMAFCQWVGYPAFHQLLLGLLGLN